MKRILLILLFLLVGCPKKKDIQDNTYESRYPELPEWDEEGDRPGDLPEDTGALKDEM